MGRKIEDEIGNRKGNVISVYCVYTWYFTNKKIDMCVHAYLSIWTDVCFHKCSCVHICMCMWLVCIGWHLGANMEMNGSFSALRQHTNEYL